MTEVRTRDEAIASVDQALHVWSTNVTGLIVQAQNVALVAKDDVESIVRRRANEVAAVEAHLAAADSERSRQLQAELIRTKQAHEKARHAFVRVNDVLASVSQLSRIHTTAANSQVASARAQLSAMSRALEGYRDSGAVLGDGGSSGGNIVRAAGISLVGMGITELDVSSADLDENPILDDQHSGKTFGKGGLSRADYRWAVQTWHDTVGPGVASGKTREDFAERDSRTNAQPLRRTADVYDIFLGTNRILADRQPDGSLNIVNGRHRLLIARELGIKNLPGQVS
jgi:hypothetical protein